jgi:Tol biopolymer transport system component
MRSGADDVEHYFTINTDGTDEQAIFDREGCTCAQWSADGSQILTLDATDHGTYSFMTIRPDGSGGVILDNPSHTLNLAPGASTADGRMIAFAGWDDTNPAITGLYVGSPDLTDLRLVMPLRDGIIAVEPFGITPDGSQIVFFGETGPDGGVDHAGHNYVVNSDGTGLRQLDPAGTITGDVGAPTIGLSPDGQQAVFTLDNSVWVVDLAGGDARQIANLTGFMWAASWSPTGEWITFTRFYGATQVIALIRPDGSDKREISVPDETDEAGGSKWSPDGKHLLVLRDSDSTQDGPRDLWIMDLDGNYIGQVTHEPSDYVLYSWAPVP